MQIQRQYKMSKEWAQESKTEREQEASGHHLKHLDEFDVRDGDGDQPEFQMHEDNRGIH